MGENFFFPIALCLIISKTKKRVTFVPVREVEGRNWLMAVTLLLAG